MLKLGGISSVYWIGPLSFLLTLIISCQNTCGRNVDNPAIAGSKRSETRNRNEPSSAGEQASLPHQGKHKGGNAAAANSSIDCPSWSELDPQKLPPLSSGPYIPAFEQLWSIVLRKHYDPTLNCLDWPQLRLQYGVQLDTAKDREQAYRLYNQLLAQLGQSHLRAVPPPDVRPGSQSRNSERGPARVPIQMRWIDKQWIVVRSQYGDADPIPPGAVVVSIAAKNLIEVQKEALSETALSHDTTTKDSLKALSFEQKNKVESLLHCPEGGSKKVKFLDPHVNDEVRERTLDCILPAGERASLGNLRNLPTRITWKMIKGTSVGYLAFNYWMMSMVPKIELAISELVSQGMTAMLIDLRGNPGGIAPMVIPVARLLLEHDGDLGQLAMRDFSQKFNVTRGPNPFVGPLDIMIDESSASTSEIFSLGMRDLGRVTLVGGSVSAGMALPSLIEKLPDGGLIQYVVGTYKSSQGNVAEGGGVKPDILVDENRQDFVAGRDSVLEAAIEHVQRVEK